MNTINKNIILLYPYFNGCSGAFNRYLLLRDLLKNIKVGQIYIFHFNIVGRDYKGRNFTNIRCWRITEDDSPQDKPNQVEQKTTYISTQTNTEQDDDLPF